MKKREGEIAVLGIESSCDETAAAVTVNGIDVRSNIISSQIEIHTQYGGVVPEIASRKHVEKIDSVVREALAQADAELSEMDAIAVTSGPGLVGALLVGVSFAKALAFAKGLPLVGVHHIEGHISANFIEHPELRPPFLCLVASGGHSHLVMMKDHGEYDILGQTRDDAAGEAFDKVARAIGLGYPGGPKIDRVAQEGNADAIRFPQAKIADAAYDFSFSGLKSAVLNYLNHCECKHIPVVVPDLAASFQKAVVETLVSHTMRAAQEFHCGQIAIAGGVASNSLLRREMQRQCEERGVHFYRPSPILCTDNAAMISCAGYYMLQKGIRSGMDLNAEPNLPLGDRSRRFHAGQR